MKEEPLRVEKHTLNVPNVFFAVLNLSVVLIFQIYWHS